MLSYLFLTLSKAFLKENHDEALDVKKPRFLGRNGALFGRRDWTRTNDPHHVKAPASALQPIVHAGFASGYAPGTMPCSFS